MYSDLTAINKSPNQFHDIFGSCSRHLPGKRMQKGAVIWWIAVLQARSAEPVLGIRLSPIRPWAFPVFCNLLARETGFESTQTWPPLKNTGKQNHWRLWWITVNAGDAHHSQVKPKSNGISWPHTTNRDSQKVASSWNQQLPGQALGAKCHWRLDFGQWMQIRLWGVQPETQPDSVARRQKSEIHGNGSRPASFTNLNPTSRRINHACSHYPTCRQISSEAWTALWPRVTLFTPARKPIAHWVYGVLEAKSRTLGLSGSSGRCSWFLSGFLFRQWVAKHQDGSDLMEGLRGESELVD